MGCAASQADFPHLSPFSKGIEALRKLRRVFCGRGSSLVRSTLAPLPRQRSCLGIAGLRLFGGAPSTAAGLPYAEGLRYLNQSQLLYCGLPREPCGDLLCQDIAFDFHRSGPWKSSSQSTYPLSRLKSASERFRDVRSSTKPFVISAPGSSRKTIINCSPASDRCFQT